MILHFTVGSAAAYIWIRLSAGILALEFDTGLVIGTFVVSGTFCVTPSSGVSQESSGQEQSARLFLATQLELSPQAPSLQAATHLNCTHS